MLKYYRLSLLVFVILALALTACDPIPANNPILPVHTAKVVVNGETKTILTDARGFALYYYPPDTVTTSACTGDCAGDWPPLLRSSGKADLSNASLSGKFTVQHTANGDQVEYNGHLLYTYIGDMSAGEVTGDNVNNWFVATPDLA